MKYVICPGWISSRNDGQRHFISFHRLIRLYQLKPADCVLRSPDELYDAFPTAWPRLGPRYDGNYRAHLPMQICD